MRGVVLTACMVLAACGSSDTADPPVQFREMPGLNNFALVIPETMPSTQLKGIAKDKCGEVEICDVLAWTQEDDVARAWPMTDQEYATLAFQYKVNRNTGYEGAFWDCDRYKDRTGDECLSKDSAPE